VLCADSGKKLEAVLAGEVVVEDQGVDAAAGEVPGKVGAAGEGDYRELAAVRGTEKVEKRFVIVDVKDRYSPRFSSILLDSPSFSPWFFLLLLRRFPTLPRSTYHSSLSRQLPLPPCPLRGTLMGSCGCTMCPGASRTEGGFVITPKNHHEIFVRHETRNRCRVGSYPRTQWRSRRDASKSGEHCGVPLPPQKLTWVARVKKFL